MSQLVYFSNVSENTRRFVGKLGIPADRIPVRKTDEHLTVNEPYVLVTPTYGGGEPKLAIPRQVAKFLNDPHNRSLLRGVIAAGNTNFGVDYCLAGRVIAEKTGVPVLYRFELLGTPDDVTAVQNGLEQFWTQQ